MALPARTFSLVLTTAALALAAFMFVAGLGSTRVAAQTPSATDLAARIQAHYATVRDFTSEFTLEQTSGLMPSASKDRGRVEVKKPARMRWTFTTGDKNEVVADGVRMYSYFPRDRYVIVSAIPADDQVSTALLFLAGRGNLTRDFTPSVPATQPAGEWQLALAPKTKQPDFRSLTIQVNRQTLAFTGLIVVDSQGGIQKFRFENLRENRGLADASFTFAIPRGVEVRQ